MDLPAVQEQWLRWTNVEQGLAAEVLTYVTIPWIKIEYLNVDLSAQQHGNQQ